MFWINFFPQDENNYSRWVFAWIFHFLQNRTFYKPNHTANQRNGFIMLHAESTILFLLNCYVSSHRGVILKLQHASESQEGLIKTQISGSFLYKILSNKGGGAKNLYFWQMPRWYWCSWSVHHIWEAFTCNVYHRKLRWKLWIQILRLHTDWVVKGKLFKLFCVPQPHPLLIQPSKNACVLCGGNSDMVPS